MLTDIWAPYFTKNNRLCNLMKIAKVGTNYWSLSNSPKINKLFFGIMYEVYEQFVLFSTRFFLKNFANCLKYLDATLKSYKSSSQTSFLKQVSLMVMLVRICEEILGFKLVWRHKNLTFFKKLPQIFGKIKKFKSRQKIWIPRKKE